MPGPYLVEKYPENDPNPDRIAFRAIEGVAPSADERAFSVAVAADMIKLGRLCGSLVAKYRESPEFRSLYDYFYHAAVGGLQRDVGHLDVGRPALEEARTHALVTVGRKVRNKYIGKVLAWTLAMLVASLLVIANTGGITDYISPLVSGYLPEGAQIGRYVISIGIAGIGIFLGMNLANLWYLTNFTWDKIDFLDRAGLPAYVRVLGVWFLTLALMALLAVKAVIVGIMSIELNSFAEHIWLAGLIGLLCGGGEVAVSNLVQRVLQEPAIAPPPKR